MIWNIYQIIKIKHLIQYKEFLEKNNFDEYLEYYFSHDNFLLIHYGLVTKDCTIIKSSNDFRKYLYYCLENSIHDLRQFGKENL